ncbi:zinc finger, CCHC-type containing protein [Tanacetum coccineum]
MVIEEPEYGIFCIDVFDDEAFQTMSDINKVGLETLITYLVMASNITTLENTRFCLNLRKLIADHPDQEKLKSKKELEAQISYVGTKLIGLQLFQLELRLEKIPFRRFHLLLISLGASRSLPYGCLGLPLVYFLVPVMTHETKHRSILKKEKLNGNNFLDWYRNLRIVLGNEQKLHHLEEALPEVSPATTTIVVLNSYARRVAKQQEVAYLMVEEGQSVSTYVLKMTAYLDQIDCLGYPMPLGLGHRKIILELHAMLKLAEKGIPKKAHVVLAIRQGQIWKPKPQARGKGKGKSKLAYDPRHKIPPLAKKEHPTKDTECHHCHKLRHWKRNCPLYLA